MSFQTTFFCRAKMRTSEDISSRYIDDMLSWGDMLMWRYVREDMLSTILMHLITLCVKQTKGSTLYNSRISFPSVIHNPCEPIECESNQFMNSSFQLVCWVWNRIHLVCNFVTDYKIMFYLCSYEWNSEVHPPCCHSHVTYGFSHNSSPVASWDSESHQTY